jgi:hypothetical protein
MAGIDSFGLAVLVCALAVIGAVSPTRQPQPPGNLPERAQLLAALAAAGVTEDDDRLIEKAWRLVDQVNARLSARGATLAYAVTCNPVGPVQTRAVPDRLVLEDA